ncbi:MAG: translation initiation factor IF-2 N-terminal domain-containing protein, partial [Proteobacteria bacterium]|nr:translation initiation factor IF-2 N-terminal domain-containing protein [Pseudomonadota bacterium]
MTKLKVKDLAAEIGIGHKEILQHLRDMDIQVKSFMSTLEDDEADRLRQSLRGQPAAQTDVVRREVGDVIVRSRKARPEAKAAAPAAEEKSAEGSKEALATRVAAKSAKEAAEPVVAAEPREEAPKAARVVEPADRPARIIKRQDAPAEPVAEPVAEPALEAVAQAPQAQPEAVAEAKPEPKAEATARIVTRVVPPVAAELQEPARAEADEAKAEPAPPASAESAKAEPVKAEPAAAEEAPGAAEAQADELDEDGKKKRKPKREVIVPAAPQVRVISRPEPGSIPPAPARRPEFSANSTGGGARPYTPHPGGARPAYDGPRGG